ncbi:MAG TPA: carboxypeptidase regulatory-like domain-containing protein [Thermoanaerobaculia bacterium]|nr:carboxypeptidase regulatory-like domain-containing protein [Thermoanaerobaculia bacterium]
MRKSIALTIILVAFAATNAFAVGEARLTGKVVDTDNKPIADATITVTATAAKTFKETFKTNKNGDIRVFLLDGTIPYRFVVAKDGFQPYEEVIKLRLVPEKNERTFILAPAGTSAAIAAAEPAQVDPAITAYNDGVGLLNEGKGADAIAKLQEAVALKSDFGQGYKTLAIAYARGSQWAKAIEAGNKAIEIDGDDPDVAAVLSLAYEKTGDKAKAAEFRKKAPQSAPAVFNDAAKLINAGKDGEAEPLLKQAIGIDPAFAIAYYELGMLYARSGKNGDAKTNLEKYIELEPKGRDVATAKEMLNYVK